MKTFVALAQWLCVPFGFCRSLASNTTARTRVIDGDIVRTAHASVRGMPRRLPLPNQRRAALALLCLGTVGTVFAQTSDVSVSGNIITNTCTIDTPSLAVDMGQVNASEIRAAGVGSAIAPFSSATIQITCQAGANPQIAFIDPLQSGIGGAYIELPPGAGVAGGVGIQLFRGTDDSPIALSVGYFAGQNVPAGPLSIPFRARYYRAATNVTAGSVNATALFDIAYD